MKRILPLLLVLISVQLIGQQDYSIFKNATDFQNQLVHHALMVELDAVTYQDLLDDAPSQLKLNIPIASSQTIQVDLEENHILADDFMATSKSANGEQSFNYQPGLYYKGKIVGHPNSWVAISFFDDEIIGVVSFNNNTGNFVIGSYVPNETYDASAHIIYSDAQMAIQNNFDCHSDDDVSLPASPVSSPQGVTSGCARPLEIYIEADYQLYLDKSSNLTTANNFITGFFNVSATIYSNSSVNVTISQTTVWTSTDPYPSGSSSLALDAFAQATQNSFNGDLAHFVSSVNAGNGGLAWVGVICGTYNASNQSGPYAYSNIGTTYASFPTYSWTVMVFTHETGHNIASPHTHSCSWNGNNTQIDDCGNIASSSPPSCYNASNQIVPSSGGTIMSYCHLNAVGINLNFHSQVETLMQNTIAQTTCLNSSPYCTSKGNSTNDEWIASFSVGTLNSQSGNNGGYFYDCNTITNLNLNTTYSVTMTPGYSGNNFQEYFTIWLDLNQDGDFSDANEQLYSSGPHTSSVTANVTIPATASLGQTVLRLSMKYNAASDTCETFSYGEVEDYIINITNNSSPLSYSSSTTNATCNGSTDGSIDITISGATAPITYSWSNNATTEDLNGIGAGTYSCTVTDANSNVLNISNITITEPTAITASVTPNAISCSSNAGTALVSATGGAGSYTYAWSNGTGNVNFASGLSTGASYTVTVTDANNCSITEAFTVAAPTTSPYCSASGGTADEWIDSFAIGSIANGSGDNGGYSYFCSPTTTLHQGATYPATMTPGYSGTAWNEVFKIWIDFNQDGDFSDVGEEVFVSTAQNTSVTGNITIPATATAGATHLRVAMRYNQGANTCGTYQYGEVEDYTVTIGTNAAPLVVSDISTNVSCNGGTDGSIDLTVSGGVGGYTYSWNNAATTEDITGLSAGTYSCTITDANGTTTTTGNITITQPSAVLPNVTITQPLCVGNTGSAMASPTGGAGGFTYAWSNSLGTNNAVTGLIAGNSYTVTVTDANGCTGTQTISITAPTAISSSANITDVACNGGVNGAISLTVNNATGTPSYVWSNTATTQNLTGLGAGSYTVTVTDANGCTHSNTFTITEPTAIVSSVAISQPICSYNTGSATANVSGGTSGYTYLWSDNSTGTSTSNLGTGTVTVTITDVNGCTSTASGTVNAPPAAITSSVTATDVLCNGDANGSIALFVNNAAMPATYAWSNNATTASINNLGAGNYNVTVTDANGCIHTTSGTVTEPSAISLNTNVQHACNGNDGAITVVANGGTAPYTITPNNLNNLSAGTYTVSVTDANNCLVTSTVILEAAPVAAFDTSLVERTVTFTNNSQNGNSYLWLFGDGTQSVAPNPTYTYQTSGDFTVTLVTTNVCGDDTATIDITVYLVGTETIYDDKRVTIYPNPTTDMLNIDFNINGNWKMDVFDVTGRLLKSEDLNIANSQIQQLKVSDLASGTYFLVFQSLDEETRIVKKFIVEK